MHRRAVRRGCCGLAGRIALSVIGAAGQDAGVETDAALRARVADIENAGDSYVGGDEDAWREVSGQRVSFGWILHRVDQVPVGLDHDGILRPTEIQHRESVGPTPPAVGGIAIKHDVTPPGSAVPLKGPGHLDDGRADHADALLRTHRRLHRVCESLGLFEYLVEASVGDQINRAGAAEVTVAGAQPDPDTFIGVDLSQLVDQKLHIQQLLATVPARGRMANGPVLHRANTGTHGPGKFTLRDTGTRDQIHDSHIRQPAGIPLACTWWAATTRSIQLARRSSITHTVIMLHDGLRVELRYELRHCRVPALPIREALRGVL